MHAHSGAELYVTPPQDRLPKMQAFLCFLPFHAIRLRSTQDKMQHHRIVTDCRQKSHNKMTLCQLISTPGYFSKERRDSSWEYHFQQQPCDQVLSELRIMLHTGQKVHMIYHFFFLVLQA